ncbi:MAG: hypothetical protein HKL80_06435, partial [Acidimicrobiales bacterium]|nr:hypothetical protein [Acidimicrobiales bacterium]
MEASNTVKKLFERIVLLVSIGFLLIGLIAVSSSRTVSTKVPTASSVDTTGVPTAQFSQTNANGMNIDAAKANYTS